MDRTAGAYPKLNKLPLGSLSTLSFAVPQVPLIRGPGAAQLEERRAPERPRCSA
jgi:hypothetical protein